jgi:hypothetical protein
MPIFKFLLETLPNRGEPFLKSWARIRALGMARYIIQTALLWTALTAVSFELMRAVRQGTNYQSMLVQTFPNGILVLLGSGLVVAALLYLYNEWRYSAAGGR